MIAFIVPQVFTAYAYMSIKGLLDNPIDVEIKKMPPYQVEYKK